MVGSLQCVYGLKTSFSAPYAHGNRRATNSDCKLSRDFRGRSSGADSGELAPEIRSRENGELSMPPQVWGAEGYS